MDWNPGPKYELYLSRISDLLSDEKRTVRDVYYALEATGFPDECAEHGYDFEYRYVKRAVKKGRRSGYIDPELIIDTSRQAVNTADAGHDDPVSFLNKHVDGVWNAYEENFWDDQSHYVEVWLEKASLASVFQPICEELNARLEATRGDWSDSKVYRAARRLRGKVFDEEKQVRVVYFGDYNPSGLHAPVAIQNTMAHYGMDIHRPDGEAAYFDIWPFPGPVEADDGEGDLAFERWALNTEHIERFDLPENPNPSSTDKDQDLRERFMRHVSEGRDTNVELNALKEYHREYLEDEVRESIEQYIDDDDRTETANRIEERKASLADAISVDYDAVQ